MDGVFDSLREVAVKGAGVANDDECRADKCETGKLEGGEDVSERENFKDEVDEAETKLYADTGIHEDGFRRKEALEKER